MGFFSKWEGINPASAITGGIGGIFGLIGQNARMRKQHQNQLELMNQQYSNQRQLNLQGHQLQMDMWKKTNYPAQMKMMEEAGLNPALMYGMSGGGGTTTGSQGGGSASGGQAGMLDIGSALASAKLLAEIDNIKAQTNKTKEETKSEAGTIENMLAELTPDQRQQYTYWQTQIQEQSFEKLSSEATEIYNKAQKTLREKNLLDANFENMKKLLAHDVIKRGLEIQLEKENIKKTQEEIDVLSNSVYQRWTEIGIKGVDTVLKGVLGGGGVGALLNLVKRLKGLK
jgi:primosomal protein N'